MEYYEKDFIVQSVESDLACGASPYTLKSGAARRLQRAAYLVVPCVAMHVACAFADERLDSAMSRRRAWNDASMQPDSR